MALAVFLILAAGALFFAANVVFRRNPAVCAVHLVGAFFCLAGIYFLIGFPFLAALQLLVYAGAIMVLFLFVIMLLDLRKEEPREKPVSSTLSPIFAGALLGLLAVTLPELPVAPNEEPGATPALRGAEGGRELAAALFGRHALTFEATSLLLLAGILGVVSLAKARRSRRKRLEILLAEAARAEERRAAAREPVAAGHGGE